MRTERNGDLVKRASVHAALSDPARLQIVDRLMLGDASPSELAAEVGLTSNLLAHHLSTLQAVDLIVRTRSEGDRRRTYIRLRPGPLLDLVPTPAATGRRVVFVCTHNSARSQLAAAAWRQHSKIPTASAGVSPAARVHPKAIAAGHARGLRLGRARTAHVDDVVMPGDLVVAVCDNAFEDMQGQVPIDLHWSVSDPVRVGTDTAFEQALDDIEVRVDRLAKATQAS